MLVVVKFCHVALPEASEVNTLPVAAPPAVVLRLDIVVVPVKLASLIVELVIVPPLMLAAEAATVAKSADLAWSIPIKPAPFPTKTPPVKVLAVMVATFVILLFDKFKLVVAV